jgi:hypothetical protein
MGKNIGKVLINVIKCKCVWTFYLVTGGSEKISFGCFMEITNLQMHGNQHWSKYIEKIEKKD